MDEVYVSVRYGRTTCSAIPSSLKSAEAYIHDDISDMIYLGEIEYNHDAGGYLIIDLEDFEYYGLLDKSKDRITIGAVSNGTCYEGSETFSLDGKSNLGKLCLVYCELISLEYFNADVEENGNVKLDWETSMEEDNAGFNIFRSESEDDLFEDNPYPGKSNRINFDLIPSKEGAENGATYTYVDRFAECGKIYYYGLQDIDIYGVPTNHIDFVASVITPDCE